MLAVATDYTIFPIRASRQPPRCGSSAGFVFHKRSMSGERAAWLPSPQLRVRPWQPPRQRRQTQSLLPPLLPRPYKASQLPATGWPMSVWGARILPMPNQVCCHSTRSVPVCSWYRARGTVGEATALLPHAGYNPGCSVVVCFQEPLGRSQPVTPVCCATQAQWR
jgi:hypothetical protein